jgi:hypothetical protein
MRRGGPTCGHCTIAQVVYVNRYDASCMNRNELIATVGLAVITITMMTSNQVSLHASSTTEDDGYTYPDDASEEEKKEIDEREQEAWEDAGRPGERDDDDNDDDGPNPYCDLVPDNYQGACHDRLDYYESGPKSGLYPCNDGTDKADWRDCKDATKKDSSSSSDNDIPECQNGVTQKCVISEIGLICSPGYDLSNPSIVGGGHACQDIYAGTYEPESESDNNFNPNNDNDNSNSDNIPACSSGVLQRCVIEDIGLICSTEELTHDSDAPSIVGGGHACYNAYHGTYKPSPTLKTCKDGTLARSCGGIGYNNNDNNNPSIAELTKCSDGTQKANWRDCDYRADGSYPCSDGTHEVDLKACNIAARLKNNHS